MVVFVWQMSLEDNETLAFLANILLCDMYVLLHKFVRIVNQFMNVAYAAWSLNTLLQSPDPASTKRGQTISFASKVLVERDQASRIIKI